MFSVVDEVVVINVDVFPAFKFALVEDNIDGILIIHV